MVRKLLIIFLSLCLFKVSMAQNISELIGEIKFVQSQNGGYYLLIAGGQKYNLINLPKQQGQVKEGKYYVMGISTVNSQDSTFTGEIPFQVTKLEFKGALNQTQSQGQTISGATELSGYIFFYNKNNIQTYVLSVLGQNNSKTFYSLVNIPIQPGHIKEGLYKVTVTGANQNPSGFGIPVQLVKINPLEQTAAQQGSQPNQQNNNNGEQEFIGKVFFMALSPVEGGPGNYILQTQGGQYTLINLPQQQDKKYQPGQYKVKGLVVQDGTGSPYNLGTPLKVTAINLISPDINNMENPPNLFESEDGEEGEDGENSDFFDGSSGDGGDDGGGF